METKVIKGINLILLFSITIFTLVYRNWVFLIDGKGLKHENELLFGIINLLKLEPAGHYGFSILIFCSVYITFLFTGFILFSYLKGNRFSNIFYSLFIGLITITFSMLLFNFEREYYIPLFRTSNPNSFAGFLGKPQLLIDMNAISLATYFYSILLSIISFSFFIYQIVLNLKKKRQSIEDHLIENINLLK